MTDTTLRAGVFWVGVLVAAGVAGAQCSPHWVAGIGVPGIGGSLTNQSAIAMKMWDPDGAGPLAPVLVVAGRFTSAGGVSANCIATWNPTTGVWAPLGTGMNGFAVRALAVLPNGQLVAGGQFTTAGGVAARNIARWNGSTWAPLGAGLGTTSDDVVALAVLPNGDLAAGGFFANNIARWDGSTWAPIGTGFDSGVDGLLVLPNGDLIAGGDFNATGGGLPVRHVARWSGGAWSALGAGVGYDFDYVLTVAALPNGDIVAGGNFATPANGMARWDGSTWSALGTGLGGAAVESLLVLPNGDLIVAGHFASAGGVGASNIARWDGSAWSALGAGVSGSGFPIVYGLGLLSGGDIIAGGLFPAAGGVTANNIARYSSGVSADFNHDGDTATDADIEDFFACIAGNCCALCGSADFNGDGDTATDADIEAFFRVLAGGSC